MNPRYLGLDWGTSTVGVALAITPIAQPLDQLPNNGNLISAIQQLITDYEVTHIVIGQINPELSQTWLEIAIKLPIKPSNIITIDEAFSTEEAWYKARDRHLTWQQFKPKEHSWSAAIILQRHLDTL